MTNHDIVEMASRCIAEINLLRAQNNELAPKAHAYDMLTKVLNLLPGESRSYSEDIVRKLQRQIEELKSGEADNGSTGG